MSDKLTYLQTMERGTLTGDQQSAIEVVSSIREYREVVRYVLAGGSNMDELATIVRDIEECEHTGMIAVLVESERDEEALDQPTREDRLREVGLEGR